MGPPIGQKEIAESRTLTSFRREGENWIESGQIVSHLDRSAREIARVSVIVPETGDEIMDWAITFAYRDTGDLEAEEFWSPHADDWTLTSRTEYQYDSLGRPSGVYSRGWEGGGWVDSRARLYIHEDGSENFQILTATPEYDSLGMPLAQMYPVEGPVTQWNTTTKENHFISGGRTDSTVTWGWDGRAWSLSSKAVYSYPANTSESEPDRLVVFQRGQYTWLPWLRIDRVPGLGGVEETVNYRYDAGDWVPVTKQVAR